MFAKHDPFPPHHYLYSSRRLMGSQHLVQYCACKLGTFSSTILWAGIMSNLICCLLVCPKSKLFVELSPNRILGESMEKGLPASLSSFSTTFTSPSSGGCLWKVRKKTEEGIEYDNFFLLMRLYNFLNESHVGTEKACLERRSGFAFMLLFLIVNCLSRKRDCFRYWDWGYLYFNIFFI